MASTILLVDDDPDVREVVRAVLRTREYIVHEAGNGQIGLDMIDEVKPDLIILDLMLPGMSGLEVLKNIRTNQTQQAIPLLILSAAGDKSDHPEEFWRQGLQVDEYMSKANFSPENLLGRVAYLLKRGSYKSLHPSGQTAAPEKELSAETPEKGLSALGLASASPAEVVRCFIEAWNEKKFGLEFECLGGKMCAGMQKNDYVARRLARAEEPREKNTTQKLREVLDVQADDHTAMVKVRREDQRGNRAVSRIEVYTLEQASAGWKIVDVKLPSA